MQVRVLLGVPMLNIHRRKTALITELSYYQAEKNLLFYAKLAFLDTKVAFLDTEHEICVTLRIHIVSERLESIQEQLREISAIEDMIAE